MIRQCRRIVGGLAVAFLFGFAGADAYEPLLQEPRWRTLDDLSELPNLYVNDIAATISGDFWIATDRSIGTHDGTVYTPRDAEFLPSDVRYNKLLYDVVGTIWAGTSSGLIRYVGHQWRLMLDSGDITAITESVDGTVWVGVSGERDAVAIQPTIEPGIYRYRTGAWTRFGSADGLPAGRIQCLYGDAEGGVWAVYGTDTRMDGLFRYDGTRWRDMIRALNPPSGTVLTISQTRDGALWFGTYGRGVWRWNGRTWDTFSDEADLATFTAASLLPMPDGTLWAAGAPAGTLWSWDSGRWMSYPLREVGITGRQVNRMLYAFDDAFWFVIPGSGLARFDRRGGPWWVYGSRDGFPSDASTSIIRESADRAIWFGTSAGLIRFHDGQFASPPELAQLTDQGISAILPMPDGSIWAAGGSPVSRTGVWRLVGSEWSRVVTTPLLDEEAAITTMFRASNGDVWIGTREWNGENGYGVAVLHDGGWTRYTDSDYGLRSSRILSIAEDAAGGIWIGTPRGAARFDGAAWHPHTRANGLMTEHAWTILGARDGSVWIGGNLPNAGVSRYAEGVWTHFTVEDGLASDDVWSIIEDEHGVIWIGTAHGVNRFDGTDWTTLTEESGLAISQVWGAFCASEGSLWFGHFGGSVTKFRAINNQSPKTFIEPLPERIAHPGFVTVRWWGRDWWDRTKPEDLRYRWRIDGGPWSPLTKQMTHTFPRLSRGTHVFEAHAIDQEGNIDRIGAVGTIFVEPPFWMTWWFLIPTITAIVAVTVLGSIAAARSRQYRRAQSQLMGELQRELQVAHQLQASLLPQRDPTVPGLEITGTCIPASQVGGDYFTYLWAHEGSDRIGIVIADVTGHAMQAAIPAVLFSGMLVTAARQTHRPNEILSILNDSLYTRTDSHTFICCTVAVFDLKERMLSFANAGGLDPLRRSEGSAEPLEIDGNRLPLGMIPRVFYNERQIPLESGDTYVFLTDGIVEAKSPGGELFGFDRVSKAVEGAETVDEVRRRLLDGVSKHLNQREPDDDITLLVVRVGETMKRLSLRAEKESHHGARYEDDRIAAPESTRV